METKVDQALSEKVYPKEPSLRIAKYEIIDGLNSVTNTILAFISQSPMRDDLLDQLKTFKDLVNAL